MKTLRARVVEGKLVPERPTSLREGAVVDLAVLDEGDDLESDEHGALQAAISESWASLRRGEGVSADDVLRDLERP